MRVEETPTPLPLHPVLQSLCAYLCLFESRLTVQRASKKGPSARFEEAPCEASMCLGDQRWEPVGKGY